MKIFAILLICAALVSAQNISPSVSEPGASYTKTHTPEVAHQSHKRLWVTVAVVGAVAATALAYSFNTHQPTYPNFNPPKTQTSVQVQECFVAYLNGIHCAGY